MNLKGYASMRIPVPVSVQNLVLRDYCQRHGHVYGLADVEFVMPDSYLMLRGLAEHEWPIVAYSMFLAPAEEWGRLGKEIHFALENYVYPRDIEICNIIWKLNG